MILRIGFVGAGGNTRTMHLPGFQKIPDVTLELVANRSADSSARVARDFGIRRTAADWRAVVQDPEVDAVCVGTWPDTHSAVTIAALEAGKHVLCEARMARDLSEARQMADAAAAHPDLVAQLVPAPFSLDFDAVIATMLAEGRVGELREVRVVHTGGQFADVDAPMNWRQDVERSGRNTLTLGIMHETVERWVGDEPAWIIADGAVFQPKRRYHRDGPLLPVRIAESLSVIGRFGRSGARLVYHFSGVESGKPRMEFRLNGSKGALRFDAFQKQLFFAAAGSSEEEKVTMAQKDSRGWQVEADFVASIRERRPVTLTSFEQGVRYMTFTEMVHASWTGGAKRVEWPGAGQSSR